MSDNTKNHELASHGWTAVPRAQDKILANVNKDAPAKISVSDIKIPNSEVVRKTQEYAKKELPEQTYNHSMRVYYYGKLIPGLK